MNSNLPDSRLCLGSQFEIAEECLIIKFITKFINFLVNKRIARLNQADYTQ